MLLFRLKIPLIQLSPSYQDEVALLSLAFYDVVYHLGELYVMLYIYIYIYMLVDISNVASLCYKSLKSGCQNAGFILLICILLILLLILSICFFSFYNTWTFAAAAAFAVYNNFQSLIISWRTFPCWWCLIFKFEFYWFRFIFVVWSKLPASTSKRCFDAGDLFLMLLPYCNSSLRSCLAILTVPLYQILCIVFWYPRNIPLYANGFVAVGLVPGFFAVILVPKVRRLSSAGIYSEYAWIGVILIVLWYVWLYSHVACMITSTQNSLPSLAFLY